MKEKAAKILALLVFLHQSGDPGYDQGKDLESN